MDLRSDSRAGTDSRRHRATDGVVLRWLARPLFGVLAVFFFSAGVSGGVATGWDLTAIVEAGRSAGPLWVHLLFCFGLGALMVWGLGSTWRSQRIDPAAEGESRK